MQHEHSASWEAVTSLFKVPRDNESADRDIDFAVMKAGLGGLLAGEDAVSALESVSVQTAALLLEKAGDLDTQLYAVLHR